MRKWDTWERKWDTWELALTGIIGFIAGMLVALSLVKTASAQDYDGDVEDLIELEFITSGAMPTASCVVPAYNRDEWKHWTDDDHDCQDTRQEVLIRDSEVPVVFWTDSKCRVRSGKWTCPYTGEVVLDPRKLQVDHVVALNEAHLSGGWAWTEERKEEYANDLKNSFHLRATLAAANQTKKAHPPDEWLPDKNQCDYVWSRLKIKTKYNLTLTPAEAWATAVVIRSCP